MLTLLSILTNLERKDMATEKSVIGLDFELIRMPVPKEVRMKKVIKLVKALGKLVIALIILLHTIQGLQDRLTHYIF